MNHSRLLLFLTICLAMALLPSCKKIAKDRVDATILVKQYKTDAHIAGAMVLISRGKPPGGFGTVIVDTIYTDANGYATYKKHIDPDYMYYAQAIKENYFPHSITDQVDVRAGIRNFNTYLVMYAKSYVKVHLKNVNPYDQYDLITLPTACINAPYFIGSNVDTIVQWCYECDCVWQGDYEASIPLAIRRNFQESHIYVSVKTIPFDTTIVEVNY